MAKTSRKGKVRPWKLRPLIQVDSEVLHKLLLKDHSHLVSSEKHNRVANHTTYTAKPSVYVTITLIPIIIFISKVVAQTGNLGEKD